MSLIVGRDSPKAGKGKRGDIGHRDDAGRCVENGMWWRYVCKWLKQFTLMVEDWEFWKARWGR